MNANLSAFSHAPACQCSNYNPTKPINQTLEETHNIIGQHCGISEINDVMQQPDNSIIIQSRPVFNSLRNKECCGVMERTGSQLAGCQNPPSSGNSKLPSIRSDNIIHVSTNTEEENRNFIPNCITTINTIKMTNSRPLCDTNKLSKCDLMTFSRKLEENRKTNNSSFILPQTTSVSMFDSGETQQTSFIQTNDIFCDSTHNSTGHSLHETCDPRCIFNLFDRRLLNNAQINSGIENDDDDDIRMTISNDGIHYSYCTSATNLGTCNKTFDSGSKLPQIISDSKTHTLPNLSSRTYDGELMASVYARLHGDEALDDSNNIRRSRDSSLETPKEPRSRSRRKCSRWTNNSWFSWFRSDPTKAPSTKRRKKRHKLREDLDVDASSELQATSSRVAVLSQESMTSHNEISSPCHGYPSTRDLGNTLGLTSTANVMDNSLRGIQHHNCILPEELHEALRLRRESDNFSVICGNSDFYSAQSESTTQSRSSRLKEGKSVAPGKAEAAPRRRVVDRYMFLVCSIIGIVVSLVGVGVGVSLLRSSSKSQSSSALSGDLQGASLNPSSMTSVITSSPELITIKSSDLLPPPNKDDDGWVYYPQGSVNGSRYKIINKVMTFYAAQGECGRLGGYLARINTIREQLFLENFLSVELNIDGVWPGAVGFWIGAKRARGSHGDKCMFEQWKWTDAYGRTHGVISGFTAFIPGKPDNYYNPEECLFMSYRDGESEERFLKWDDAPCDLNSVGGIKALCEVDSW